MKTFFPNGNAIFSYGPQEYKYIYDYYLTEMNICELIAKRFLECKIGIQGLYYDHNENKSVRPNNLKLKGRINNSSIQNPIKAREYFYCFVSSSYNKK